MIRRVVASLFLAALSAAAGAQDLSVAGYLDDALDKLQAHHVNRANMDWSALRRSLETEKPKLRSIEQAHAAIRRVIADLGEPHTFLVVRPGAHNAQPSRPQQPLAKPLAKRVGHTAYIRIPTFVSAEAERELEFLRAIRSGMRTLAGSDPCGWIVDLRANEGGNMYPGLLALAPLVGEGLLGGVSAPPNSQYWHHVHHRIVLSDLEILPPDWTSVPQDDGKAPIVHGRRTLITAEEPWKLKTRLPIAVLLGPSTASAGEALAVMLLGASNARSFGAPSAGRTSGNVGFRLGDDSFLIVTVGHFQDRTGKMYRGPIQPVVVLESDLGASGDAEDDRVVVSARRWLESSCGAK